MWVATCYTSQWASSLAETCGPGGRLPVPAVRPRIAKGKSCLTLTLWDMPATLSVRYYSYKQEPRYMMQSAPSTHRHSLPSDTALTRNKRSLQWSTRITAWYLLECIAPLLLLRPKAGGPSSEWCRETYTCSGSTSVQSAVRKIVDSLIGRR